MFGRCENKMFVFFFYNEFEWFLDFYKTNILYQGMITLYNYFFIYGFMGFFFNFLVVYKFFLILSCFILFLFSNVYDYFFVKNVSM